MSVVFDNCITEVGGIVTGAAHGEYIVDSVNCRRCLCNNGSMEDCEASSTCLSILRNPTGCSFNDSIIPHGRKFNVRILQYI